LGINKIGKAEMKRVSMDTEAFSEAIVRIEIMIEQIAGDAHGKALANEIDDAIEMEVVWIADNLGVEIGKAGSDNSTSHEPESGKLFVVINTLTIHNMILNTARITWTAWMAWIPGDLVNCV